MILISKSYLFMAQRLMLLLFLLVAGCDQKDLPKRTIFQVLLDTTQYSTNYSENEFQRITNGMSIKDVEQKLGLPLRILLDASGRNKKMIDIENGSNVVSYPDLPVDSKSETTGIIYYYSKTGKGNKKGNWFVRAMTFSPDGKVVHIAKDYYGD